MRDKGNFNSVRFVLFLLIVTSLLGAIGTFLQILLKEQVFMKEYNLYWGNKYYFESMKMSFVWLIFYFTHAAVSILAFFAYIKFRKPAVAINISGVIIFYMWALRTFVISNNSGKFITFRSLFFPPIYILLWISAVFVLLNYSAKKS